MAKLINGRIPPNSGTYKHVINREFEEWFRDVHGASSRHASLRMELGRGFEAGFRKALRWVREAQNARQNTQDWTEGRDEILPGG